MILPYPQWRNIFPSEPAPSLAELIAMVAQFNCDDVLQSFSKLNVIYSRIYRGGEDIPVEFFKLHFAPDAFERLREAKIQRNAVFPYRPAVIFLEKLALMDARSEGGKTVSDDPILFGKMLIAAAEYAEGAKLSAVQYDDADEESKQRRREILAGTFYRQLLFNNPDFIANLMGRYWAMLILYPGELKPLYPNEFFDLEKFFEDETGLQLEIYLMFAFGLFGHYVPGGPSRPLDVLANPAYFPIGKTHFDTIRPEHHASARRFLAIFSRSMNEFRAAIAKERPSPDAGGYDARFIFESPLYQSGDIHFPLDLDLVMQQATSGLYWKAHSILRPSRKGDYDRFKTWWGRLFEWHIRKVLEGYLPGKGSPNQRLFVEREDGFEGTDFVILDGESMIVIEVTTSAVPVVKAMSGSGKEICESLSRILIQTEHGDSGKAAQLSNFIEGFKSGTIRVGSIDPKTIKHIFPVILSEQGIPHVPPFIGMLRADIFKRTRLGEASGWLEFWDAGEIEQMGGVIGQGLAAFIASKYVNGMGDYPMQNYLHATRTTMPSTVIGDNFAQFGARAKATFFRRPPAEEAGN